MPEPSPNGLNGRDHFGKFLPGNGGGPGNPHARRAGKLRTALLKAVTEKDIRAVAKALVAAAKSGDIPAAKLLLDRVLGKPVDARDGEADSGRNRILEYLHPDRGSSDASA